MVTNRIERHFRDEPDDEPNDDQPSDWLRELLEADCVSEETIEKATSLMEVVEDRLAFAARSMTALNDQLEAMLRDARRQEQQNRKGNQND